MQYFFCRKGESLFNLEIPWVSEIDHQDLREIYIPNLGEKILRSLEL